MVAIVNTSAYMGNPSLKKVGTNVEWTPEMVSEWEKCREDSVYFTNNYIKIINLNDGLVNFIPYDYQVEILKTVQNHRYTILNCSRQSGKTTALVASILHYAIFNDEKTVAILANKRETALEILGRVQLAYENLPSFLQHGVVTFNKSYITLENKSRIMAFASSSGAIRGYSINFLFIDECVSGDTLVTVKDINTGEVFIKHIEDLYEELSFE